MPMYDTHFTTVPRGLDEGAFGIGIVEGTERLLAIWEGWLTQGVRNRLETRDHLLNGYGLPGDAGDVVDMGYVRVSQLPLP